MKITLLRFLSFEMGSGLWLLSLDYSFKDKSKDITGNLGSVLGRSWNELRSNLEESKRNLNESGKEL